ncbi:NfeD family protein [Legionella cardiaca]|uniref:Uncharacterized protein n=1 Tax=Legionella cardiaca TaxID=1071983 RepID=A0ABY8AW21_9GAMM|nr:hypothetical protein [Legionella cardiaca]WED43362.1 hypothetical protein PXX05_00890 [Legionella cardiaca]
MPKNISVVGIMIGAEYKDFKLYHIEESWEKTAQHFKSSAGTSEASGFQILQYLANPSLDANTQFIIAYDVASPNKEAHIKTILTGLKKIKKNDLLPTLVAIGHESSPWSEDIMEQVTFKEVESTDNHYDLFKSIIDEKFKTLKDELPFHERLENVSPLPEASSPAMNNTSPAMSNISMLVLDGFIFTLGIAAIAVAFTVLNAATFGVGGLIVAGLGVAAALTGFGLFTSHVRERHTIPDESPDFAP